MFAIDNFDILSLLAGSPRVTRSGKKVFGYETELYNVSERHWNKMTNAKTLNFWNDDNEMSMGGINMMTISDRFGFQE